MLPICLPILTLFMATCKASFQNGNGSAVPMVRVGIMEQRQSLEFKVTGQVVFSDRNQDYSLKHRQEGRWRVDASESRPAKLGYRLLVGTTSDRSRAHEIVTSLRRKGLEARVESRRRSDSWSLPYLARSIELVFLEKEFRTLQNAETFQRNIRGKTGSEIVDFPLQEASGTLVFTSLDNKDRFESRKPVRVSAKTIEVFDVQVGVGYHWQASETRQYGGTLEFLIDPAGGITLINENNLEEYLKGVVPSEMPVGFPLEALKAQAIAARVEAVSKIGFRHPFEPFDLCDDVHCQVFSGQSKNSSATNRAVENTRGIFIVHRDRVAEAFYAGVCGGHTENNDNVWLTNPKPYLRGVSDTRRGRGSASLQQERSLQKWIDDRPDVYCNTLTNKVPESLNYSKKYFRWEVSYDRPHLEKIIRKKTGQDVGTLLDLVARKRGVSGRILELEVIGSKKRFTIDKELAIRQALSESTLFSACFYTKKQGNKSSPSKFIIKGAGWGHGVGMCQIGAAVMADSGKKFDEILTHYYTKTSLRLLYN